ncbi:Protein mlp1 [Rhizina undulata]
MASPAVLTPGSGDTSLIDVQRLSAFLEVSEDSITALSSIAEEYVITVLRSIADKSKEYDELKADKLRVDIELEQKVRTSETRFKALKSQLDTALKDVDELRTKVTTTESARSALETEIRNIKDSHANTEEEVHTLRIRIQSVESDKRDTLEALNRKSTDYDRLQDDYSALQAKAIETRREISAIEGQLQQAQSAQTSAKFREQNLAQELELVKKNNEWMENELKTKAGEFQKFRKEKAAQISTLQRELDDALSQVDRIQRSYDNLKQRFDEVSKKAKDTSAKVRDLQDKAVSQEEAFKNEMSSQQRLTQLYEQSAKTSKDRVLELERLREEEHENLSAEVGQIRAEMDTERAEREAAENRVTELELTVERLEADLDGYASGTFVPPQVVQPGSRRGSTNGTTTPMRRGASVAGSPAQGLLSPAAARLQKSGLSMTQLYSDYVSVKASYDSEHRRNAKLEQALQEIMQELETRAPEMEELRQEHDRLVHDLAEMSKVSEGVMKDRDMAKKETRKLEKQITQNERESTLLRQQLRDLSTQIQVLLVELEQRDRGNGPMSATQNMRFEQIVTGQITISSDNEIDKLISERLVVFRNIKELQEQNEHLLSGIRDLSEKIARDEEERRRIQEGQEAKEVTELKGMIERLKDEMKTIATKAQSFVRERDMFRRMLQNRGDIPKESLEAPPNAGSPRTEASTNFQEVHQNISEVLKELQNQYDQFKAESMSNQNTLSEQNRRLASEKTELEVQIARVNSQLEMASERYEMLNGNFGMLKSENQELQKRVTNLLENQSKQDLRTQQVAEELIDNKSLLESMRTENANLKAEKTLWKNIEQRLSQDNVSLVEERARLNDLIANLQSIQSERERSDSETRRRLVSQVEKLESELQQSKRRLNEEIEESKKAAVRKEIEAREAQKKFDELNATLAGTRESLAAAKAVESHLQTRVDELSAEFKSAEERLAAMQPKEAPTQQEDEEAVSREQELEDEVAELRKRLELTKSELENTREQIEQYKTIAQSSEEELNEMNEAHDAYKEDMERQMAEHEAKIKDLEQRLADTSTELASLTGELSQQQQQAQEARHQFEQEKSLLESQIANLKEDAEKQTTAASFYQDDLRAQARIAQEAQHNYERELVKHAEAAQQLQVVRAEFTELKMEVHQIKNEAESAKATLANSENSWETQKENYEKELGEVKGRCEDLVRQNKILLGQLDSVSEQVSSLQKSRNLADEANEDAAIGQTQDKSMEDLREVIKYLRREKEIVDVQYELSLQEGKRVKQQLDYAKSALDETRALLAQERQKEADQLRGATQHKELMEKISELNLLRESNTMLRADAERKGKKVTELQSKVEELRAKIEPLEAQVRELEAEKEVKDEQMRLLTEDNDRWKSRVQQILQKYDRVDPAELETLREQAKSAEEKFSQMLTERDALQAKFDEALATKQKELAEVADMWREKLKALVADTKSRIAEGRARVNEESKKAQDLDQELKGLKEQYEKACREKDDAIKANEELQVLREEKAKLTQRQAELDSLVEKQQTRMQAIFKDLSKTKSDLKQMETEKQALEAKVSAGAAVSASPVPADNSAFIEAEVQKRLAAMPKPDTSAAVDAEVQKRLAEIQAAVVQPQQAPQDHSVAIEEEVKRRVAEIQSQLQAQAQTQSTQEPQDNSAAIEAEVQRRLAEMKTEAPTSTAEGTAVVLAEGQQDLEAIIEERLKSERERIEKMRIQVESDKAAFNSRYKEAQLKFKEYKQEAVHTALKNKEAQFASEKAELGARFNEVKAELEKKLTDKDAEHQQVVQDLNSQIETMRNEILKLKKIVEELEKTVAELKEKESQARKELEEKEVEFKRALEEKEKALKQKEEEHKKALEEVTGVEAVKIEEALAEQKYALQADFLIMASQPLFKNAQPQLEAAKSEEKDVKTEPGEVTESKDEDKDKGTPAKAGPSQDQLKNVIKRNVEHRLSKEREKWEKEKDKEREKEKDKWEKDKDAWEKEKDAIIEAKIKEKEAELMASQQSILEKGKDALRQEGAARLKVQLSMLEKKNKTLEEKVKAFEAGSGSPRPTQASPTPHTPTPPAAVLAVSQGPPTQPPQQGQQQGQQQQGQQQQGQQQQGRPPSAIPQLQPQTQSEPQQEHQQLRRENQGTGPATLRSLRGALQSNIPRGGASIRGNRNSSIGIPQPQPSSQQQPHQHQGSQSPPQPHPHHQPQSHQSQIPQPYMQMPPQGSHQQQQQQQQGYGRGMNLANQIQAIQQQQSGLPTRGRGFGGRGRPQGQQQQQQGQEGMQGGLGIQTGIPGMQGMQGMGSPGGGRGMNPGARQFVPNKRSREDLDEEGGFGKRVRGGHHG